MTHFLRDKENNTIIEIEVGNKENEGRAPWVDENGEFTEISTAVNIKNYSLFLLQAHNAAKADIIDIINDLSELRGWLWEVYFMDEENDGSRKKDVEDKVSEFLKSASQKLGLNYITD